ncbi:MAG: hypothetical protein E7L00_10755 [Propionibacteriaceae bacterium]|nr:hypothetical protein [Propionibacteriaceae bacterium]
MRYVTDAVYIDIYERFEVVTHIQQPVIQGVLEESWPSTRGQSLDKLPKRQR